MDAGTELVFSLSRSEISTVPDDFELPEGSGGPDAGKKPLDWHLAVTDANSSDGSAQAVARPGALSAGRREHAPDCEISSLAPSEVVMRRYRFALKDFAAANRTLDATKLR